MSEDRRDDPKLGTILNGTYRLESVLGTGGMGTVYLAKHVHLGTEFAIKSLVPQFTDNEEAVKRFQREAQISSQLGHPNIVHVIDFNYDDKGTPYMVMDLLRGETLRARLQRKGRLGLVEALPIIRQMCEGLAAAHLRNVVHRDLKPENLFLCEGKLEQLKVLDFGVSKIRGNYNTQLTRPMAMLGTPFYMSPEQAQGQTAEVDMLSDVWAVGAIVYETLTGSGAFAADNPVAVFYKIVNDPLPAASQNGADVPQAVDRVLAKACAKSPSARYQSTLELFRELEQAAVSTAQTRPLTVPEARARLGIADQPTAESQLPDKTPQPLAAESTRLFKDADKTPPPLAAESTRLFVGSPPKDGVGRNDADKTPPPLAAESTRLLVRDGADKAAPISQEATRLINAPPAYPVGKPGLKTNMIAGQAGPVSEKVARALAGSAYGRLETEADDEEEPKTQPGEVLLSEQQSAALNRPAGPTGPAVGDATAQVLLPSEVPTNPGASKNITPVIAGETRATRVSPAMPLWVQLWFQKVQKLPRWQLAAVAGGVFIAVAALSATVVTTRRGAEQRVARGRLDSAMAARRWGEAEHELRNVVEEEGDSAELAAVGTRIVGEKRAEEQLRLARELRTNGDLGGAMAELRRVDAKSAYAAEVGEERKAVAAAWEEQMERAVRERRCADAQAAAKRLTAIDGREVPAQVAGCREREREPSGGGSVAAGGRPTVAEAVRAFKRRDYDQAFNLAQSVVRGDSSSGGAWRVLGASACMIGSVDEAKRARSHLGKGDQKYVDKLCHGKRIELVEARREAPEEPPLEAGSLAVRDAIQRMMGGAEASAKKCFARTPGYKQPMKLRVTAFPGSDHFVATAVSTGPIEIRSCLEGLFKGARPPRATAAISAERVYSPE